jgi:hypothetical protein
MEKGITKVIHKWDKQGVDKVFLMCDCIGPENHFLVVSRDREFPDEFYVAMIPDDQGSIWGRIKYALWYIWNGPHYDTVCTSYDEIKELAKTLGELLEIKKGETNGSNGSNKNV